VSAPLPSVATTALHVAQVSFFVDPQGRDPRALLEAWPSLVDVAQAPHAAGVRVSVLQASSRAASFAAAGVDYHFLVPPPRGALAGAAAVRELLAALRPDVLHVHGLGFPGDVAALAAAAPALPILLQDHADRPPRWWRRGPWRRGFAAAAGIAFCARAQAEPFRRAGLIGTRQRIYEIPESTSRFTPGDQALARRATGIAGDPCLLWVGHLDANKDPLTVLRGFSAARAQLPQAQLWCYFGSAPLRAAVERHIAADPALRDCVHLAGSVPHAHIEQAMRAADLFVLGSHREGSGYALIEALACALPPVVTDIPSFRALVGARAGALWACDDPRAFCAALLRVAGEPRAAARAAAAAQFAGELSFAAVGRKLRAAYEELSAAALRARPAGAA
jgi:glycosyltransferase involved in cell wall biosynthesis